MHLAFLAASWLQKRIGRKEDIDRILEYNEQVEMCAGKRRKPLYVLLNSHTARHTSVASQEDKTQTRSEDLHRNENLQDVILFNV